VPRLPVVSARKVIRALLRLGFAVIRQSGSHIHLWHDERRVLVTVPNHPELARGTLNSILKQGKLSREEFLEQL